MAAPRIDTVRGRLGSARDAIVTVLSEIEDLHSLAYDRRVGGRDSLAGGRRANGPGSLDAHGDPRARDAYAALAAAALDTTGRLAEASQAAIALLREGGARRPINRRLITSDELVQALAAQARRASRGSGYVAVAAVAQPQIADVATTIDRIIRERDTAVARVADLEARLAARDLRRARGRR